MNTCEHYRLQISQLLDGELPEAQPQTPARTVSASMKTF